ncbi:hypothetical protein [Paenibacillus sedimenti]|uniref:Uncharacterized protein n=1 Tax=Paenibacillus sedimenti TaxID=2770274 RepID=A0A926KUI7_9BACL|nr:hypothetical protein [Paenibacillus sedimenti]MBD0384394.1 hypothetical protein [Paenibacillus sedimenti]
MGIIIHQGNVFIILVVAACMVLFGGLSLRDLYKDFIEAKKERHLTIWVIFEILFEFLTPTNATWLIIFIAGLLTLIALSIEFFRTILG